MIVDVAALHTLLPLRERNLSGGGQVKYRITKLLAPATRQVWNYDEPRRDRGYQRYSPFSCCRGLRCPILRFTFTLFTVSVRAKRLGSPARGTAARRGRSGASATARRCRQG